MKIRNLSLQTFFLLSSLLFGSSAIASEAFFTDVRTIKLLDVKNVATKVGTLRFTPTNDGIQQFDLKIDHDKFKDFFLSMKEMKCLEGEELWCHIPYPHQTPVTISVNDLRWLEHALIFMFKDKKSFGANFWNGIYYKLAWDGNRLVGDAQHVDLNMLAAPPDNESQPPIGEFDIEPVDPEKRWLSRITIE